MKRSGPLFILSALLAFTPCIASAESAVPNPGAFFSTTPEFDPMAGGTKYSGHLTIAYVFVDDLETCPDSGIRIDNMYTVITLAQGNRLQPFDTDFVESGTAPFCFIGEPEQIEVVLGLIRNKVIPHFYDGCFPGTCPDFKVKSVTDFVSSGTGAISMGITIAVP